MSQFYKSKYEQMRENSESTRAAMQNLTAKDNPPRNVCFVLADGSQVFLNYGYLISGSIDPQKEKITLSFTSHEVCLEGVNIDGLFYELLQNKPWLIKSEDSRYAALEEKGQPFISTISVVKKE